MKAQEFWRRQQHWSEKKMQKMQKIRDFEVFFWRFLAIWSQFWAGICCGRAPRLSIPLGEFLGHHNKRWNKKNWSGLLKVPQIGSYMLFLEDGQLKTAISPKRFDPKFLASAQIIPRTFLYSTKKWNWCPNNHFIDILPWVKMWNLERFWKKM